MTYRQRPHGQATPPNMRRRARTGKPTDTGQHLSVHSLEGVRFYAWHLRNVRAHILPGQCVEAYRDSPFAWFTEREMPSVTKRQVKLRKLPICEACAFVHVRARLTTVSAVDARKVRLQQRRDRREVRLQQRRERRVWQLQQRLDRRETRRLKAAYEGRSRPASGTGSLPS